MKVLFIVPKYPMPIMGGLEKQALLLAEELVCLGVEVTVLSGRYTSDHECSKSVQKGVKIIRPWWIQYYSEAGGGIKPFFRMLVTFCVPIFIVRNSAFDIVHTHSNSSITYMIQALYQWRNIPVIRKMPNIGKGGVPGLKRRHMWSFYYAVIKRSAAIVALNEESANELQAINLRHEQIVRLPNGVRIEENLKWENTNKRKILTFIGRLTRHKGLFVLLEAWHFFITKYPDANMVLKIVGDGPDRDLAKKSSQDFGINESVIFYGRTNDVNSVLLNSTAFVLPSFYEGQSNSVLEAMSLGVPVIASDLPSNKLQLGEAEDWVFHQPGDVQGLVESIEYLYLNDDAADRWSRNLKERTVNKFDIKKIAQKYIDLYGKVSRNHV